MPHLSSNDPVSRAIAFSFLDFLQHSLELSDRSDAEALEVATDCLRTVFKLDPSGSIPTGQPSGSVHGRRPDLLPEIFRLLLNQGFGSPEQNAGVSGPGLQTPDSGAEQGLGTSGPGLGAPVPGGPAQGFGNSEHGVGVSGSRLGGPAQGLGNAGQGLRAPAFAPQHLRSDVTLESSAPAQLQSERRAENAPVVIQNIGQEAGNSFGNREALLSGVRPAGQSEVPASATMGGGTEPSATGEEPSTPQQKEQRLRESEGAVGPKGRGDAGKQKEGASGDAGPSGSESSVSKWRKEAEELKKQGNDAMASGRFFEALELYTQAVSMVDTEPIYYANRAAAHTQLRRFDLAIKDCEQSIRLDPTYARAYSRLGLAYFEKGEYQTAIDKGFAKALELDPDNAIVKQNLKAAQDKLARQAGRGHPQPSHQHPPNPQEASSGAPQSSSAQSSPQVPQSVQGFVDMASNFFTPFASMATGATTSGQNQPGQAPGGSGTGGHAPGGHPPGSGAHAPGSGGPSNQGGGANPGPRSSSQPGQPSANLWGHFQQAFGGGQGAPGNPMFTVNVGGDQAGQQAQQMLTQMFQAFGAAAQRGGGQPNPGPSQGRAVLNTLRGRISVNPSTTRSGKGL